MNDHTEHRPVFLVSSSPPLSDANEHEDFDIVEYARFYGLCKDSTKGNALQDIKSHSALLQSISELEDPLCAKSVEELEEAGLKERINVDRDAVAWLQWISLLQQLPPFDGFNQLKQDSPLRLKLELPLLKTNHELDMRDFCSLPASALSQINFSLEELDDETGESLTWPSSVENLPAQYDAQLKAEKVTITREVLLHLQSSIKDCFTKEDEQSLVAAMLPDRTSRSALEPITPPLFPLSPPHEPCIPSSPFAHFELLSESTNSTAAEAQILERALFGKDRIVPQGALIGPDPTLLEDCDIGQIYSPLQSVANTPSPQTPKRVRPEDLKVEGPMTPPMNFETLMEQAKTVPFNDDLREYIPELPSTFMHKHTSSSSQAEFDRFFDEIIKPLAEDAERKIDHEQLRQDGNVQRVDVPTLGTTILEPPWMEVARKSNQRSDEGGTDLECQKRLLSMIKHECLRNEKPWPGISKLERQLTWSPFSALLAKPANEDGIRDDDLLPQLLESLNVSGTIDSGSLTWKPEGLRILDDSDEEDDELDEGIFQRDQQSMQTLLRKRRIEMDDEVPIAKKMMLPSAPPSGEMVPFGWPAKQNQSMLEAPDSANKASKPRDSGLLFGGMFSATTALQNFMKLHGVANISAREAVSTKQPAAAQRPLGVESSKPSERSEQVVPPIPQTSESDSFPTEAAIPTTPTSFIVNSQVLAQRHLFRRLEQLFPSANFIERDLSSCGTHPSVAGVADEADLILSPSTGLLWTTLQKIKQRPLPGQAHTVGHSTIKARIQATAPHYERLFVLVSAGAGGPSPGLGSRMPHSSPDAPLDERDSLAFADLSAFVATLTTHGDDVSVSFIPGGEETLARWIVSLMAQFATPQQQKEGSLMAEETAWEMFLRRAGLNACAAQVVLAEVGGLEKFVRMGREARVRRLEVVMGGRKALERVGRVVDSRWPAVNSVANAGTNARRGYL